MSSSDSIECARCKAPFSTKNEKRVYRRIVVDPDTNKRLILCNACGLKEKRKMKTCKTIGVKRKYIQEKKSNTADKENLIKESQQFTKKLTEILKDEEANKLICPVMTSRFCGCVKSYLSKPSESSPGDIEIAVEKASELLKLHKKSKELMKKRLQRPQTEELSVNDLKGYVNLRTVEYDKFVFSNREKLKRQYKLCERAVQRILSYSYNFLHKQLKTSNRGSRLISKRLAIAKHLPELSVMPDWKCCNKRCSAIVGTHRKLVEGWRNGAFRGHKEARAVLNEMLTPAAGAENCNLFIQMITGCSMHLINSVKREIKRCSSIRSVQDKKRNNFLRRKKGSASETKPKEEKASTSSKIVNQPKRKKITETEIEDKDKNNVENEFSPRRTNESQDADDLDCDDQNMPIISSREMQEGEDTNSIPVQVVPVILGDDIELDDDLSQSETMEILILVTNEKPVYFVGD